MRMARTRVRICRIVSDLLPPEQAYGYFVSFYHISKMQRDRGQEIIILKPARDFSKGQVASLPVISIPLRKRGFFPSDRKQFLKAIGAVVTSWDADIIHTHISVGCYLHGMKEFPPTVHHIHGLPYQAFEIWEALRGIGQRKNRFCDFRHDLHADILYRKYLRRANAVVVFAQSIRADVIQRYRVPPDNVHVIFNGVSSIFLKSYPKSEMRKKLNLEEDCFFVLFVGRLVEGKGIIPLLKALEMIKKKIRGKNIQLMIVGSKFGTTELQSLVRAFTSRENSVIEVPHVPYEHLPQYYTAADLHVIAHTYGRGFPKTCLESLACGTPVIMTKNLDAEIILGQNERGLLLNDATDHHELARKIQYFVDHEDLVREMGERGRRLIRKKFTWEKTIEKLSLVYHKVLEDS